MLIAQIFFSIELPILEILLLLAIIPCSNLYAQSRLIKQIDQQALIGGLLTLDTLLLTGLLYLTGGPTNPFSIVFLLHVVLAAILLNSAWTWTITTLATLCFALLFVDYRVIPEWSHAHMGHSQHHGFSLHLHGMLFALCAVAVLVAYFINHIVIALRKKERRLQQLENLSQNQQRLMWLTTLIAGSAHELGTPLGTIGIIAYELERELKKLPVSSGIFEDLELLKSETIRCKQILSDLGDKTGDIFGEMPEAVNLKELLNDASAPFLSSKVDIRLELTENLPALTAPRRALLLAFRALIKNALEASADTQAAVIVRCRNQAERVIVEIIDSGKGLSDEQLSRLGEPFFSTKPGQGLGLGVYLARLTAQRLGGQLQYTSHKNTGTTAQFEIPREISMALEAA